MTSAGVLDGLRIAGEHWRTGQHLHGNPLNPGQNEGSGWEGSCRVRVALRRQGRHRFTDAMLV
jgi:hypothetical protein